MEEGSWRGRNGIKKIPTSLSQLWHHPDWTQAVRYTNNSSTLVVEIYVRLEDWYVCRVEVATGHQWLIIIFHFCCLLCWHLNLTPDYILRACICLCASCSLSSTSAKSARSRTRASSVLVSEATEAGQQYTRLFVCICWEMRRCFICAALEISMDRYLLEI